MWADLTPPDNPKGNKIQDEGGFCSKMLLTAYKALLCNGMRHKAIPENPKRLGRGEVLARLGTAPWGWDPAEAPAEGGGSPGVQDHARLPNPCPEGGDTG